MSSREQEAQPYTLSVLTQADNVSEDAPYMMRMLDIKLPKFAFMQAIFAVLPQIEKQHLWIEKQIGIEVARP